MNSAGSLPFRAPIEEYQRQAEELLAAAEGGDGDAAARLKWEHPRFKRKTLAEVREAIASLDLGDAQTVIAQEHSFDTWADLADFVNTVAADGPAARFEAAVDAVVDGDLAALQAMLRDDPGLVHARSPRRHHCTLLHYLGANGVERGRQKTPPNAVEVMTLLLATGADPNALADLYDAKCTTMAMLVSSSHPANAGLQAKLAETLLDHGAKLEGAGTNWQSAVLTALTFGYRETAEALVRRGAPVNDLPTAAGLGRADDTARLLPSADARSRQIALALAAQLGNAEVVRLLLDAGADPSEYCPEGFHSHATPLHNAVWNEQDDIVRLLVDRGARLDIKDKIYLGTPLDWAIHGNKTAVADFLRSRGALSTSE